MHFDSMLVNIEHLRLRLLHNHFNSFSFPFFKIKLYFSPWKGTLTDDGDEDGGATHFKNVPKTNLFYIVLPLKGTLTDAGDGDGGDT